jgi:hypothetical protein
MLSLLSKLTSFRLAALGLFAYILRAASCTMYTYVLPLLLRKPRDTNQIILYK